ncbi:hypothetical protein [Cytobacillus sp. FSL R5-0596]|uniref:hypothetical protein n=1 Tax=Cytobacillus sp. FSL R5-0596 TaxID=2954696 RepID=UPI0030F757B6
MKYIEISLTKCKILLTEKELLGLLSKDVELYKESLKRGKAFYRKMNQQRREAEQFTTYEVTRINKYLH